MTTYKLIENNNPILSIPLSGCSEGLNRQEVKDNLVETMKGSAGVGLSANQCGVMERECWFVSKSVWCYGTSLCDVF